MASDDYKICPTTLAVGKHKPKAGVVPVLLMMLEKTDTPKNTPAAHYY
jgi:hypothetical protein